MRALVSGGTSGIGAAACLRLAEAALARGDKPMIAVCGHEPSSLQEEIVRSIQSMGGTAIALSADLGDPDVPARMVAATVEEFGGLDALVSNAGIANPAPLSELSVEDWDGMFAVNVRAAWLLAKASYPHLAASQGAACFTSSMSGQMPHAGSGAYSPTKAALTLLAQNTRTGVGLGRDPRERGLSGNDPHADDREDVRGFPDQTAAGEHHSAAQDRGPDGRRERHRVPRRSVVGLRHRSRHLRRRRILEIDPQPHPWSAELKSLMPAWVPLDDDPDSREARSR